MNIQKIQKSPLIHRVEYILEDKGLVVTACGIRADWDRYKVVTGEVSCGTCLIGLYGPQKITRVRT